MSLVSWSTSSLISGVSQQPETLRYASQAELQENAYSSVVDGLVKRHPTSHLNLMETTAAIAGRSSAVHAINRDVGERYLVVYTGGASSTSPGIKVWDIGARQFREVEGPGGTGNGSTAADFSYLNNLDPNKIRSTTVADNTFVLNPQKAVEQDAAVSAAMSTDAYIFVKQGAYNSKYTAEITLYDSSGNTSDVTFTVNTWNGDREPATSQQPNAGQPINAGSVTDQQRIVVGSIPTLVSGDPPVAWTASFLGTSHTVMQGVNWQISDIHNQMYFLWNATNGLFASRIGTQAAGYTSTEVKGRYTGLEIRPVLSAAPSGGSWTVTQIQSPSTDEETSIQTSDIADRLMDGLVAATSLATFTRSGSVIKCVPKYGPGGSTTDTSFHLFSVTDSNADSMMRLVHKKIDVLTDLPLVSTHGFKIEVQGDKSEAADNFYLEFEAKDGAGAFGEGVWKEAALGGLRYKLKADTMPHRLERFFTAGGDPYFVWGPMPWVDREVGDDDTNPFPSFCSPIGQNTTRITDIFFHRNRMGLLSNDNVILSESGIYENFFRTSTTTLLDSDVIDVGVSHVSVSSLHHAVTLNEKLVLFSDQTQFVLSGEPYLTPATVQISAVTDYENYTTIRPKNTGRGVVFGYSHGDFSGVRELTQINTDVYDAEDLTASVPKYIKGTLTSFATSTLENMVAALSDEDTSSIFVYKYFFGAEGRRVQSSWSKYKLGTNSNVQHISFIENTLYIVVLRPEGLFLEQMVISDGGTDPDSTYITTLDRRLSDADTGVSTSYSAANNTTTVTLPYKIESGVVYQVVSRATSSVFPGNIYTLPSAPVVGSNTITVEGDLTSAPFWVGEQYKMLYEFSAPRIREASGTTGGRGAVATGRQQIKYGTIVYDESGHFKVHVTPQGRDTQTHEFSATLLNSSGSLIGNVVLGSGNYRFPIHSKNNQVSIQIENSSPQPSNFVSIEWEADYTSRTSRYRG